jgi:predicted ABC-class ATPase
LGRIDGRGYKAYNELRDARFQIGDLELAIDHVQGDPFASPSRIRIRHPYAAVGLPDPLTASEVARLAFRDWLARRVRRCLREGGAPGKPGGSGSGGSGRVSIDAGGQTVLDRCAVRLDGDGLEARLEVGLPAAGRRILGAAARALLVDEVPEALARAFALDEGTCEEALSFVACVENQQAVRAALAGKGLVAFVAEGSLLPRQSGVDDRPLQGGVPFQCPAGLRVDFEVPRPPGRVQGLGIPRGVTLIVGGGYHGKSTLLHAIERGVYPHIPGDGREGVVTDSAAVKIRAEDGRRVEAVEIEPFVRNLPFDRDTLAFRSDDASGSTSQAANVVEALEVGARALLMDEDSCATNFMTRDARMQELVTPEREPIIPLVDRVRELYERFGVSTVLVAGSSGDFFSVADTVIEMESFQPADRSADAKALARVEGRSRVGEAQQPLRTPAPRVPDLESLEPGGGRGAARPPRVSARAVHQIRYGKTEIDLRGLDQLIDPSQTRAVGRALLWISKRNSPGATLAAHLDALDALLDSAGIEALSPAAPHRHPGSLARPRRFEIAGALNRLRGLRVQKGQRETDQ